MAISFRIIGVGAFAATLLSACATVPPRYAYYQVPCTTPGAVLATPVAGAAQIPVAPGYPAPAGSTVTSAAPGSSPVATCVVAVRENGYGYYPYYGRYGYGPYGYGGPFYGSFGLGFGFSSHHGHFSGHSHPGGGHTH